MRDFYVHTVARVLGTRMSTVSAGPTLTEPQVSVMAPFTEANVHLVFSTYINCCYLHPKNFTLSPRSKV